VACGCGWHSGRHGPGAIPAIKVSPQSTERSPWLERSAAKNCKLFGPPARPSRGSNFDPCTQWYFRTDSALAPGSDAALNAWQCWPLHSTTKTPTHTRHPHVLLAGYPNQHQPPDFSLPASQQPANFIWYQSNHEPHAAGWPASFHPSIQNFRNQQLRQHQRTQIYSLSRYSGLAAAESFFSGLQRRSVCPASSASGQHLSREAL